MPSDQTRRLRVANGSRRKRDLQAVSVLQRNPGDRAEREARLRPKLRESETATEAWAMSAALLLHDTPHSTFQLWLSPLACAGEAEGALCLSAPDSIRSWVERRYGRYIGSVVRELSGFAGVFLLAGGEAAEGEDAPL